MQQLETLAQCPACGAPSPGNVKRRFGPYRTTVCGDCSLEFLNPRPSLEDALAIYNSASYFQSQQSKQGYLDYAAERDATPGWPGSLRVMEKAPIDT